MPLPEQITFVVPVEKRGRVLEDNFLASPYFRLSHRHQILIQEKFSSAAEAYNDAISRSNNELIVFAHQDILLPQSWPSQLERALGQLQASDPNWGVLGAFGVQADGRHVGYVYSHGQGIIGEPFDIPAPVQTLDEIVLIIRKSSGLHFNEQLRHFHFYGADICLTAAAKGMKSYAIPSFCVHNTHRILRLPGEFYECYGQLKKIWKQSLPIRTTCIEVSKFDTQMYKRRIYEAYLKYVRGREVSALRAEDVGELLKEVDALLARPAIAPQPGDIPAALARERF